MRFIGSKTALLENIEYVINENTSGNEQIFCDLFSGTGVDARHFKPKYEVYSNDMLHFSYVIQKATVESNKVPTFSKLHNIGILDPFHFLEETKIETSNIDFVNKDFINIDLTLLGPQDMVYCDPPYLITTGSYNDGNRGFKDWNEKEEYQLYSLLDNLNQQNIRFALSNVLSHKGVNNEILLKWSKKYRTIRLDFDYSNSSHNTKKGGSEEVLIVNY